MLLGVNVLMINDENGIMHCETPSYLFTCFCIIVQISYMLHVTWIRIATIISTSFIRVAILDLSPTLSSHVRLGANHLISSSLVSKGLKILDIDYYVIIYEFIRFDFIWKRTTAFDPLWLPKVCEKFIIWWFKVASALFPLFSVKKVKKTVKTYPFEDHCDEFLVVHIPVSVNICLGCHLLWFS